MLDISARPAMVRTYCPACVLDRKVTVTQAGSSGYLSHANTPIFIEQSNRSHP